jgi:mannose-6-phosphate isomerase-like protein (cupin superfamily)
MSLFRISLGIALLVGTLQGASVEFWSGSELKSSAERLEQEAGTKGIVGTTSGAASIWRRARSGEAELHKTKTDLLVIQQGSATLIFGGTIPDARTSAPNEIRGKSIRNGESRKLIPGDIILIPAGTPHQFILEKGQQVAYFALKLTR